MKNTKEVPAMSSSAVFILYKNKKQTMFENIDDIKITEDKMVLNRTPESSLTIHMNSVEYYKVY